MDQFSNHPLYRKHNIDSAMNSLWGFYKKKFLSLFIMSLVMSLVIQYASSLVNMKELAEGTVSNYRSNDFTREDKRYFAPYSHNFSDKSALYNNTSVLYPL